MQPRLTAVTLGVGDLPASVGFYAALGFPRKVRATGDEVAFFDAGGAVLALYRWELLAKDALLPAEPRPAAFRGITVGWNCTSVQEADAAFARALAAGAKPLKPPEKTEWGGYSGYFADPDGHAWEVVHAPAFALAPDGRLLLPD
jgi:predicted lactoylglutathione lyase